MPAAAAHLVGAAVVRAARQQQRRRHRLQHQALAGRHLPQPQHLLLAHHARVDVRQQARLLQHGARRRVHIL